MLAQLGVDMARSAAAGADAGRQQNGHAEKHNSQSDKILNARAVHVEAPIFFIDICLAVITPIDPQTPFNAHP
ncbi:hypothetical protein [Methylobacterium indicum]|uniref:hypothetical protein n=1 Tax=Methylobacterium indicum TaxID=1775910 RepID=UPI000F7ACBF0|nr:hypothetical protein [Methylobacterium indicum]